MLLRARILLPLSRPPVEDGAVRIEGDRIAAVGSWTELARGHTGETIDLGEAILLPGFINAHCHLDYTGMAGQLAPPKQFTDWIKAIVALKSTWTAAEFAASWQRGAEMLVRSGTTTVADVEAMPELLPDLWRATPLRVISFRELISLRPGIDSGELVRAAAESWAALPASEGRLGLSPHAPYTTSAKLLEHAADAAHRRRWRLTTHVAESEAEFQMFMYRQGPLYEWLKSQRDMSDCGHRSPVGHLEHCGYLDENLIAVHVNYLWRADAGVLGRHGVHVVHCPRSHEYFRHLAFPRAELERAGVNLCLGTDSLASVRKPAQGPMELSLFAEMQALLARTPEMNPLTLLQMVTINPARALGRSGVAGELSPGALADLIAVPFAGPVADAATAVVHHRGDVLAAFIGGRKVWPSA